jgi:transcriptional regulator with XRE-family HTH domain
MRAMKKRIVRALDPVDVAIGALIKQVRMSKVPFERLEWIAFHCGCSTQQMQKYETGATPITFARIIKIAAYLDVPLSALTPPPAAGAS